MWFCFSENNVHRFSWMSVLKKERQFSLILEYPLPQCEFMWMCGGKRSSSPYGADDLCLVSLELQGWDMNLKGLIWPSRLGFKPWGWDLSLEAGIWVSRLGFEPQGWDLSHKARIWALWLGFEPCGWDLSIKAKIWASRLGFEHQS